ncbi:hypothetical protein B0H19DRAFT_1148726, partial [Mycena capillaripes]
YVITGAARGLGLEFVSQLGADSRNTIFAIVRNKSTANALSSLPGNNITFRVNMLGTIHTTNIFLPLLHTGATKKQRRLEAADRPATASQGSTEHGYGKVRRRPQGGFVVLLISAGLVDTATERTPQENDEYQAFIQGFAKVVPSFSKPLTSQASFKMILQVIDRWTVEETGAFVLHHGKKK